MTMRDFCKLWNASNGRKALVLAIRAEHGDHIIDEEQLAYSDLHDARQRGHDATAASAAFYAARNRRLDAERQVRFKYGLPPI